ncbi:alpha/beta hydrolase family protein [Pseudomonas abieticivorans]|uniref:alpha/beta hydrolase family protein n=1 Tax=Pseudomonas abieticivorans TaxID=2931382 RepID=UPI0020C183A9|nr:prolyl oligopeptidase family serine peptidase [Pseudomonas sp. PIA16]
MTETHASSPKLEHFSAAQAVAAGTDFAELRVGPTGLFWNEFRPQDAACRIWRWHAGSAQRLTPDGFSVRSRVYEYGGGSFCLTDDGVIFVNESDQQLYWQSLDGGQPRALTQGQRRYGDLQYAAGQVLAVEETHGADHVEHRLVAIALSDNQRQMLAEGADFYAAPTMDCSGQRLAWIEWSRPHQPWTQTRLMTCARQPDGQWGSASAVAGHTHAQSLQQPRFDAQGNLHCLSDLNGYWQPWAQTCEGWAPLRAKDADHAGAPWQLGACTWLPLGDQGFLASWFEDGFSRLGICAANGLVEDYSVDYSRFRSLSIDEDFIYAIAASAICPSVVVAIHRHSREVQVLAGGSVPLAIEHISRPLPLRYPSGGSEAYGFFYPAMNGDSQPPLVVFIHGGPTSACYPVFDPRIQYWTQRGFAVADLNYRGSSSYGRDYRQALHLKWGEADVEDACAVVSHLAGRGLINPEQAFIRGGSAGGYTTLCALAFRNVFRAGASLYGVSDPIALARATHKFEGDYLDWLIGDPIADEARYRARTPLFHAHQIKAPVIFFQGELDAVVVPQQTRDMLKALHDNGLTAEAHFYPDERHGFRQAANLANALELEWGFYCRVIEAGR